MFELDMAGTITEMVLKIFSHAGFKYQGGDVLTSEHPRAVAAVRLAIDLFAIASETEPETVRALMEGEDEE